MIYRSWWGFFDSFRKFIKNCAAFGKPISSLLNTKKYLNGKNIWRTIIEQKKILLSKMTLNQPDYKKRFILETDASSLGPDSFLLQSQQRVLNL